MICVQCWSSSGVLAAVLVSTCLSSRWQLLTSKPHVMLCCYHNFWVMGRGQSIQVRMSEWINHVEVIILLVQHGSYVLKSFFFSLKLMYLKT